uniref:Uncharacterized protein n=1 Tax=Monodelphis domestica TaxID=13616 RepID=A0A5F8GMT0_MONDO
MADITDQGVKEIFQLEKQEGRELLRRLTKWKGFEEMKESRKNILLDILYDGIVFAVEKGFPWPAVVEVARFTEELLEETKDHRQHQAGHTRETMLLACLLIILEVIKHS